MIIGEYNTIFIHIPKNAGTSIEAHFLNRGFNFQPEKHATIHEIKKMFPGVYNSHNKFTIIRNPYDRMISWYYYLKECKDILEENDIPTLLSEPSLSSSVVQTKSIIDVKFKEWIKNPFSFYPKPPFNHYLDPQHTWIDETVTVLKFENLQKEVNKFFDKNIELKVFNKTKHENYLNYYDKETLDIVYNKYKEDFKKYNYKKL